MSSAELCELCNDYYNKSSSETKSLEPIQRYFSKLINDNKTIDLTPKLKQYIPSLANEKNGALVSMLNSTINGLSPTDFVPQLNLKTALMEPREPSERAGSSHRPRSGRIRSPMETMSHISPRLNRPSIDNLDTLNYHELVVPKTSRPYPNAKALITARSMKKLGTISYRQPLPPLNQTESDILSNLYVSSNSEFYIGKKLDPTSLDWHIIPSAYPEHLIGNEFNVMTTGGVVQFTPGAGAQVQDLYKFVEDKENEFIVENQMIRKRVSYRSFYHWRQRLREKLFSKVINIYDAHNAISVPNFAPVLEQIRQDVLDATRNARIYDILFDLTVEEVDFATLKETADESIFNLDKQISSLKDQVGQQISEIFRNIRAANVLIQLGFEELNSLNQLPPSLKQYSSDLKWRVPSIWREKMREKQLKYERKLAHDRQDYLSTFFSKVRMNYNGLLILRCKEMMLRFVDRFLPEPVEKRRTHRLVAYFDQTNGIGISPNRAEFISWVERTLSTTKSTFFQDLDKIWQELIFEVDPNYEYTIENPFVVISRYQDLNEITKEAFDAINSAFQYFETEVEHHAVYVRKLVEKLEESKKFTDLRDIDKLQLLLNDILKSKEEIDKRPKNIFHHPKDKTESLNDFIVALSPAIDDVRKYYNTSMDALKLRVINELNLLFTEINERWSAVKDKKVTRMDARALEARTLQYSLLCDVFCSAWKDALADVKASFDTVMRMYRQLSDKCKYTHAGAARHFNKVADTLGLGGVPIVEEEEEEEEEETEYEEEYEEETNE